MQDPRALLEAAGHSPELKVCLVATYDKLMNAILHDRKDVSEQDRANIGVTVAQAITEIASTGQHDPDRIYEYALSRAWAAASGLRWRT